MGPASVDDGLDKELMSVKTHTLILYQGRRLHLLDPFLSVKTHTIILLLHALAIHFFGFLTVPRGKFLFWLI